MFKHLRTVLDGWALSELPENYDSLEEDRKQRLIVTERARLATSITRPRPTAKAHDTGLPFN